MIKTLIKSSFNVLDWFPFKALNGLRFKALKWLPFLLVLLIGSSFIFQDSGNYGTIEWHERKLTWADFKGQPDQNSKYGAVTYSQFSSTYKYSPDSLYCTISCEFIPEQSWVKPNATEELLKHEQGHFDLTEYIARLFRKELLSYKFESYETIRTEMKRLSAKYAAKFEEIQDQYDEETHHSKKLLEQTIWNKRIEQYLLETEPYSETEIKLLIQYQ